MTAPERVFRVHLYGYDPYEYRAESHGSARWKCFRSFRDATGKDDFHWFLMNSRVELLRGPTPLGIEAPAGREERGC